MNRYILKGRLIDGNGGRAPENQLILVENDKIALICGENEYKNPDNLPVISMENGTLLPGFIDCHTHFASLGMRPELIFVRTKYDMLLESVNDAKKTLEAGFTSAREMGEFGTAIKRAVARGLIPGPKLFTSGRLISGTGGHGDMMADIPYDYAREHNTIAVLADGEAECLKAVRMNFREGADFIKTCSTGGVMSSSDQVDSVEHSVSELKVMVEEAERHDTYVASHSVGNRGIYNALAAGIKCIEHGVFLDERCVELMVKNDVTYDPTISIMKAIISDPTAVPPYAYRKGMLAAEHHLKSVELARKAGVRIVFGSDFLGGDSTLTPFGKQGIEFANLAAAGLTPMEAIQAGTKNASILIKAQDKVGTLEVGKTADIVLVEGNPLEDIGLLADPDNVRVVVQDGKIVKNTLGTDNLRYHQ
jgi:imidazolonepropionase-like amidohydrolase